MSSLFPFVEQLAAQGVCPAVGGSSRVILFTPVHSGVSNSSMETAFIKVTGASVLLTIGCCPSPLWIAQQNLPDDYKPSLDTCSSQGPGNSTLPNLLALNSLTASSQAPFHLLDSEFPPLPQGSFLSAYAYSLRDDF